MKSKLIAASSSLVMGLALSFMALKTQPTVSADTLALDQMAYARFQIVLFAGVILVIISFILFALVALSGGKDSK